MWPHTKSFAMGAISSIATLALSSIALARTSAFVMPASMSPALWEWSVVLGIGAVLVALLVHVLAVFAFKATAWPAFFGFVSSAAVMLLVSGMLTTSYKTLVAWIIGALLATLLYRMRSSSPSKPVSLGSAV